MPQNIETDYNISNNVDEVTFTGSHLFGGNPEQTSNQDFWYEDGISLTGNPYQSSDHITFNANYTGDLNSGNNFTSREINSPFSSNISTFDNSNEKNDVLNSKTSQPWKYNEDVILKELLEYIRGTYRQHYSAGDNKIQTLDLIEACGDGEPFCRSNILKYASRYDKKGTSRLDIMKVLHYAVLLLHFNDQNAKREVYPQ